MFIVTAPGLGAAGTALAYAALATGVSASVGAFVLASIDGFTYGAEISGNMAFAKSIDDDNTIQWLRIGATLMMFPDVAVGSTRVLVEIDKLGREAAKAVEASSAAARSAAAARARAAAIHNAARHPGPVQRRLHRARALQQSAERQARAVDAASSRMRLLGLRDIGSFQGATLAGSGLMSAAPPGAALSPEQNRRDEDYLRSLAPRGGMPDDVRLEMRVFATARPKPP